MSYNYIIITILILRLITFYFESTSKNMAQDGILNKEKRLLFINSMNLSSKLGLIFTFILVFSLFELINKSRSIFQICIISLFLTKIMIFFMILDIGITTIYWKKEDITMEFYNFNTLVFFIELLCLTLFLILKIRLNEYLPEDFRF